MENPMTEKQPDSQPKRGRADHLKPHQFKPGQSGNPGGLPKGTVQLSVRIRNKLLEAIKDSPDGIQIADAVAAKIVQAMLKDPIRAERLISKFMDRDEGPVATQVELSAVFTMEDMVRMVDEQLSEGDAGRG
jgi:hypothetical protein